jgi:hypothetical protein
MENQESDCDFQFVGRRHFGQRIDIVLIRRLKNVAKRSQRSPRVVLEQCLRDALPKLEKEAGINYETLT